MQIASAQTAAGPGVKLVDSVSRLADKFVIRVSLGKTLGVMLVVIRPARMMGGAAQCPW